MPLHTGPAGRPAASRMTAGGAATLAAAALALLIGAPAAAFDVFEGRRVYEQHCVNCHGADGIAVMPGTPNFALSEQLSAPDSALVSGIKSGGTLMPGYDRILNNADILNVIAYIRTLQR